MRKLSQSFVAGVMALAAGCGDDPAEPAHATHALVGSYTLTATFPTFTPDVRQSGTTLPADASLTGTIVVGDTVEVRSATQVYFPDVRITEVFCATRAACLAAETAASATSLFLPQGTLTFGFSTVGGGRTLHFDGPFAGDSVAGAAWYQDGTSRYDGRFVARKRQ